MNEEIKSRLKSRIHYSENGCWIYTGHISKKGYGKLSWKNKFQLAHRVSYIVFKGEIPEGKQLDHLCRNPSCINPDHLEPVTNRENVLRGNGIPAINYRKTECIHGHKFTPENTILKNGKRGCRICKKVYRKIHYRKEGLTIRIKKLEDIMEKLKQALG